MTTCNCEAEMTWNEGIPRWVPILDPDCPVHKDELDEDGNWL